MPDSARCHVLVGIIASLDQKDVTQAMRRNTPGIVPSGRCCHAVGGGYSCVSMLILLPITFLASAGGRLKHSSRPVATTAAATLSSAARAAINAYLAG